MDAILVLKNAIEKNSRFLLVNHIRMDPDALGSLGAFFMLLEKLGKTVRATNDESMPENYSFLVPKKIIEPNLDIESFGPEIIISFDAASEDQLGNTYNSRKNLFQNSEFFVIDHHITNPGFGKHNIINTTSSSSCELVYDIIEQLGFLEHIDTTIATLLLAGIHTDTNTFYNKNTTPKTFRIAAHLLEKGAKNKEIIFEFFRKKSFDKAKLWGEILKNIQKTPDGKIVWVKIRKNEYSTLPVGDQGIKGLLNEFLANIEGAKIAFLIYETGTDGKEIKASLRSNDDSIDVATFCQSFGGGGHKLAAGFSTNDTLENVEKSILEGLVSLLSA